jgi:hypothetical protein
MEPRNRGNKTLLINCLGIYFLHLPLSLLLLLQLSHSTFSTLLPFYFFKYGTPQRR